MDATAFATSSPTQSSTFVTGHDNFSDNRAPTGVNRNLSSGPDFGLPKWEHANTLAPFLTK